MAIRRAKELLVKSCRVFHFLFVRYKPSIELRCPLGLSGMAYLFHLYILPEFSRLQLLLVVCGAWIHGGSLVFSFLGIPCFGRVPNVANSLNSTTALSMHLLYAPSLLGHWLVRTV